MKTIRCKIIALCVLLAPLALKAQLGSHLGFTLGPSLSYMYGSNDADNLDMKLGYSGAIIYQYAFSTRYALQTGVMYENKGATLNTTFLGADIKARADYHYVGIPVLFRVHFMPERKLRPFVNAGGFATYLVNETTYTRTEFGGDTENDHSSNTGDFRKFDAGVAGGLGLDYLITNNMHLDFEVRDNLGLMNIDDSGDSDNTMKHNNAYFLVGMLFSIP